MYEKISRNKYSHYGVYRFLIRWPCCKILLKRYIRIRHYEER